VAAVPGTNRYLGTQYSPTNNNNNTNNKKKTKKKKKTKIIEKYTTKLLLKSDSNVHVELQL
jgi:hypothetical protein